MYTIGPVNYGPPVILLYHTSFFRHLFLLTAQKGPDTTI